MRFCSLGSGSRGNAHVVEHGGTTLLIDCGFSRRELLRRLAARHLTFAEIDAVVVTHEHGDHVAGLRGLMDAEDVPFYMSAGTARALNLVAELRERPIAPPGLPSHWCLCAGQTAVFRDLFLHPAPVPHDVREPLQFVIEDGGHRRMALFTDLGHASAAIVGLCAELDLLVVECNYDDDMLERGDYPERLKRRIASDYGHLSNAAAAALVAKTASRRRQRIIAAHLSRDNNTAELAIAALRAADPKATIAVSSQADGADWQSV